MRVRERPRVTAGAEPGGPLASLTLVEKGVEEISAPHPPSCGGGEEIRARFPTPPRRQEPAEEALNRRRYLLCLGTGEMERSVQRNTGCRVGVRVGVRVRTHTATTGQGARRKIQGVRGNVLGARGASAQLSLVLLKGFGGKTY